MRVVERCGEFIEAMRAAPLAPEVLHHAKRAVIDWVAATLPGAVVPPATVLEAALAEELDHGAACLVLGRPATVRAAALINGTAAHTAEVDDIFRDGIYHPGAPTIAAALALAQAGKLDGLAFLRAVIAGYEVSTRIARAMGRAHYRYWHNTGTIGVFGACAASAAALGLDRTRAAHALATVTTFAAGLQQAFRGDSMSKPLHAGRAAEAGVTAALAAREGVTGAFDVIEGEAGFGRAMGAGPDWGEAFATLGAEYNITRMTFKNHACCGHTFAAIDGALAARAALGVAAEDIARVTIGSYRASTEVSGIEDPRTPAEGRFSIKYVVAHALRHGSVRLAAFEPAALGDPATRALMQRVDASIDPQLDAAFPAQRAARVEIETRDGRRHALLQPARKGDPELPLDDRELEAKYLELAAPVIGDAPARALLERLWRLEREADIMLSGAPAAAPGRAAA
ncbi:MAG: MmgE/PrpD family protein [Betaproteobacteria bacterium]|nr:MmgE/PrpD family protein [Betaproteobacteria bacterium]